jgi:hypothetical protein
MDIPIGIPALAAVAFGVAFGAFGAQAPALTTLDTTTPITYFIADGTGLPGYRSSDRQLAVWAFEAWDRVADRRLRFEPAAESKALVRLYWAEPNEGQYGEMRPLVVGGRRGAAVHIRADVDGLGDAIARRANADTLFRDTIVYLTCLHELGHAIGLAHTNDVRDIMYFFGYGGNVVDFFGRYRAQLRVRNDITRITGVSDAEIRRVGAMYAGR